MMTFAYKYAQETPLLGDVEPTDQRPARTVGLAAILQNPQSGY